MTIGRERRSTIGNMTIRHVTMADGKLIDPSEKNRFFGAYHRTEPTFGSDDQTNRTEISTQRVRTVPKGSPLVTKSGMTRSIAIPETKLRYELEILGIAVLEN